MDLFDLFSDPYTRLRKLEEAARTRRADRAARSLDERYAELAAENDQLRLWVAALTDVLLAKGVLSEHELRAAADRLRPPPEEKNPFAGLEADAAG